MFIFSNFGPMNEIPSAVVKYPRYRTLISKNEHLAFFKWRAQFFIISKVVRKFFNKPLRSSPAISISLTRAVNRSM